MNLAGVTQKSVAKLEMYGFRSATDPVVLTNIEVTDIGSVNRPFIKRAVLLNLPNPPAYGPDDDLN